MRVDFIAEPEAAKRYQVIDLDSGEEIENVAWADDEAEAYGVFRMRGRTMSDGSDADLRLLDAAGHFKVDEEEGEIEIIDLAHNPLKGPLLALLEDPEVIAALKAKLGS